jgi:hypothetical protein
MQSDVYPDQQRLTYMRGYNESRRDEEDLNERDDLSDLQYSQTQEAANNQSLVRSPLL